MPFDMRNRSRFTLDNEDLLKALIQAGVLGQEQMYNLPPGRLSDEYSLPPEALLAPPIDRRVGVMSDEYSPNPPAAAAAVPRPRVGRLSDEYSPNPVAAAPTPAPQQAGAGDPWAGLRTADPWAGLRTDSGGLGTQGGAGMTQPGGGLGGLLAQFVRGGPKTRGSATEYSDRLDQKTRGRL